MGAGTAGRERICFLDSRSDAVDAALAKRHARKGWPVRKRLLLVAGFLFLTVVLRAWVSVSPPALQRLALAEFPTDIKEWKMVSNASLTDDVAGVLRADDYLLRRYSDGKGHTVDFFVAYYKTQRAGESMHSPKNCLPGSGWVPVINDTAILENDNRGKPVPVNRY